MLSRREAVACQGVVEPIVSGSVAEGFFIATEWLDGVPLTALLDAEAFRQPSDAIGATLQLLEILVKIHPNLRGLDEIIGAAKEIGPDQLERVESIRASGFAHNHIEPSNVIWTEDRGPVLIDFARAAEMGREIPVRLSPFWPTDVPRSQSNPLADIYAVGLIMLVMLTVVTPSTQESVPFRRSMLHLRTSLRRQPRPVKLTDTAPPARWSMPSRPSGLGTYDHSNFKVPLS
jgi:serine/threonine protein kinase